jgi:hypothetical protein
MDNVMTGVVVLLLAGLLWVTGAVLHWHNLKRQEKLIARLRRMALRRPYRPAEPAAAPAAADEHLRPAKRWTVG